MLPEEIIIKPILTEKSKGKDTTTGHWEIAGLVSEKPFATFPQGFDKKLIDKFTEDIYTKIYKIWDKKKQHAR